MVHIKFLRGLILVSVYVLGFLGIVASGGGGGGGGGSDNVDSAPSIGNLDYSPSEAFFNEGGGSIIVNGSITFNDPDGDVASYVLTVYDSNLNVVSTLSDPIPGLDGVTNGTLLISLAVNTTAADDYSVEVYLIDASNNASNILKGTFQVIGLSGSWVGSYSSNLMEEVSLLLELSHVGSNLSGDYQDKSGDFGILSGSFTAANFDFTSTSSNPSCPGSYTGTGTVSGSTINLTFSGTNCLGNHTAGVGSATFQVGNLLSFGHKEPVNIVHHGSELFWGEVSNTDDVIFKMDETGGASQVLAKKVGVPRGMTIVGSDMYWIDLRPDGGTGCTPARMKVLNVSSLDGTSTRKIASAPSCSSGNFDVIVDSNNAYWVTSKVSPPEDSIVKIPLDGSPESTITTTLFKPVIAMTRDDSYLYWIEGGFPDPGVIKRMPLAGGAITEIYTIASGAAESLVVEGDDLFVAEIVYPYPQNYRLLKIPTSGGNETVIENVSRSPVGVQLDISRPDTLIWKDVSGIYKIPVIGGTSTQIISLSNNVSDIFVDTSSVLWLEIDGGVGAVYEVPISGGLASPLVSDLFVPYGGKLAVSSNRIYITEGDFNITWHGRIAQSLRSGGAITSFFAGVTDATPIVTDGVFLYAIDGWRIVKMPLDGSTQAETLASAGFYIKDLVTDGVYVYWLEDGPFQPIKRILTSGGPVETLTTAPNLTEIIEVDNNNLYWVESFNSLRKMPKGGGVVTTIASVGDVADFVSDNSYVFYTMKYSQDIMRVSIDSGLVENITPQTSPYLFLSVWRNLAVDATNVYWIDEWYVGKVPKSGGDITNIVPGNIQTDPFQPSRLVVDSSNVYWTESAGGTIKSESKQ